MTKTTRKTIQSVIVLTIIAIVSVAVLSVANAFFPKPDLRGKIFGILNTVCPSGVDDATALKDNYFGEADLAAKGVDLKTFNSENGDSKTKVNTVYQALKGTNAGKFIVESEAQGRDGTISMITAFNSDGTVFATQNLANKESYWDRLPSGFFDYYKGKKDLSASDVSANTGATVTITVGGVTRAVNIAGKMGALLNGVKEAPQTVTDAKTITVLKTVSSSNTFIKYPLATDQNGKLRAIFKGDNGDIILAGLGSGYGGDMSLVMTVTADNKISKLAILESNEDFAGSEYDGGNSAIFEESFNAVWLTATFGGKSLSDIQATDNVLSGSTGATLSHTSKAIKENLINCLTYFPSAAEYIDSFADQQ